VRADGAGRGGGGVSFWLPRPSLIVNNFQVITDSDATALFLLLKKSVLKGLIVYSLNRTTLKPGSHSHANVSPIIFLFP
jgi:hypothetical protein